MIVYPAVIVHGLMDATAALSRGLPVTLLSAPGAAGYAGCLWWRELVVAARRENPGTPVMDVLDCADASGLAMSALRSGVHRLVLWQEAPGWQGVAGIAAARGGFVLDRAPESLDMSRRDAMHHLHAWLADSRWSGA